MTTLPAGWRVDGEWTVKPVLTGKPAKEKDVFLRRPVLGDGFIMAELPPVDDTPEQRFGLILSVPNSTVTLERKKTPAGPFVCLVLKQGGKDLGEKIFPSPPGKTTLLLERKSNTFNGWIIGTDGKSQLVGSLDWPNLDVLMVAGIFGSTSDKAVSMNVDSLKAGGVRPDPLKMQPLFDSLGVHWGNMKEGKAFMKYHTGNTYEGEYKNNTMDGKGVYRWADGQWYQGDFKDGKFHGNGVRMLKYGDTYEGEFKNDKYNGKGTYKWANGAWYQGDFKDGNFHGYGLKFWENGDKYKGEWRNDKRNGNGESYLANGISYLGQYKDDKLDGKGIYKWPDGGSYRGDFKDGNFHGHGVRIWPDGDRYEGEYTNDKQSGGRYFWKDGHKTWSYRDAAGNWVHEQR
jgi:hypothetical protein